MGSFVPGLFQKIQERTKALVFVFVLVDEQTISMPLLFTLISMYIVSLKTNEKSDPSSQLLGKIFTPFFSKPTCIGILLQLQVSLSAGRVSCNIVLFVSFSLSISELTYIERLTHSPIQNITLCHRTPHKCYSS